MKLDNKTSKRQIQLEKAMLLFWRKGYESTSLKDLLSELDILNGSFYHSFGSKKELFLAAIKHYEDDFIRKRNDLSQLNKGFPEKIRMLFDFIYKRQEQSVVPKGCFLFNSVSEDSINDPDITGFVAGGIKRYEEYLAAEISKAIEKGEISAEINSKLVAAILITFSQGAMKLSILDYDDRKFRDQTDHLLKSLGI